WEPLMTRSPEALMMEDRANRSSRVSRFRRADDVFLLCCMGTFREDGLCPRIAAGRLWGFGGSRRALHFPIRRRRPVFPGFFAFLPGCACRGSVPSLEQHMNSMPICPPCGGDHQERGRGRARAEPAFEPDSDPVVGGVPGQPGPG